MQRQGFIKIKMTESSLITVLQQMTKWKEQPLKKFVD